MPKGYNKDGTSTASNFKGKKKHGNSNIRNEGADGPEKPKPSQGEVARPVPLPPAGGSARTETAAAVTRAQADRQVEREQRAKMARVKSFKVEGGHLGAFGSLVGTRGNVDAREALAEAAGVAHVEGGHFYITRFDRGGHGSDCRLPTVWFECEVDEAPHAVTAAGKLIDAMVQSGDFPHEDDDEVVF